MAILNTCKISVYALSGKINEITEYLHKSKIFEPSEILEEITEKICANIDREIKRTKRAISVINRADGHRRGFLKAKISVPLSAYGMERRETAAAMKTVGEVLSRADRIAENKKRITEIKERQKELSLYTALDLPPSESETERTEAVTGICRVFSEEEFSDAVKESKAMIYAEVLCTRGKKYALWAVYKKSGREEAIGILNRFGFEKKDFGSGRVYSARRNTAS